MFLSIFAATCRPHNIIAFLDNLAQTADDLSSFEVLIKLDEGANDLIALIEDYKKTAQFTIKYLATPVLEGYYSLDAGYNELLKIADPDTYFCWLLTDEIRFTTKGWDSVLKKYIGFYPDDIFRIKLSIFQLKNYHDFFECLPAPDNYAVTTRKWLELTGGWGNFWGPDSWHQCVDFFLGLCKNKDNPYGTWRSFPIFDIAVHGQEAGQGITDLSKEKERRIRIRRGWKKHSSHKTQENFYRLALRLNAHIIASANKLENYILEEHISKKTVKLLDLNNNTLMFSNYRLPRLIIKLATGAKIITVIPLAFFYYILLSKKIYKRLQRHFHETAKQIKLPLVLFFLPLKKIYGRLQFYFYKSAEKIKSPESLFSRLLHRRFSLIFLNFLLFYFYKMAAPIKWSCVLFFKLFWGIARFFIISLRSVVSVFSKIPSLVLYFKKLVTRQLEKELDTKKIMYLYDGKILKNIAPDKKKNLFSSIQHTGN